MCSFLSIFYLFQMHWYLIFIFYHPKIFSISHNTCKRSYFLVFFLASTGLKRDCWFVHLDAFYEVQAPITMELQWPSYLRDTQTIIENTLSSISHGCITGLLPILLDFCSLLLFVFMITFLDLKIHQNFKTYQKNWILWSIWLPNLCVIFFTPI